MVPHGPGTLLAVYSHVFIAGHLKHSEVSDLPMVTQSSYPGII